MSIACYVEKARKILGFQKSNTPFIGRKARIIWVLLNLSLRNSSASSKTFTTGWKSYKFEQMKQRNSKTKLTSKRIIWPLSFVFY